ncbi:hypothetical protein V5799_007619 [Amblyomma americanum]|uniref:eIF-4F 25 kDa subunit n=1 Tax=Amblyomma americanum TaxID=6943 RepID=A0AAQ4FHG0_AMBAM
MSLENKPSERDLEKPQSSKQANTGTSPEEPWKHPLQHRWSLWYHKNDRNRSWEENLLQISSFDTVEDFWALYNHMELPSKIAEGCDYSVFKYGIKPMWEDRRNSQGGRWFVKLRKNEAATDNCWLELLLCLIGEGFGELGADVCGAVVQIRKKSDMVSVWTADYRSKDSNTRIGEILKKRLYMDPKSCILYQAHGDTQAKNGSSKTARYVV